MEQQNKEENTQEKGEPDKIEKLNWIQKKFLKRTLNKLEKKLEQEKDSSTRQDEEFKNKQINCLLELIQTTDLPVTIEECECETTDCQQTGYGHEKYEEPITKENLERKTTEEITELFYQLLKECRAIIWN